MKFKSVTDIGGQNQQEQMEADIADQKMIIEYLAMMTNVELPSNSSDSSDNYENPESSDEEV